MANRRTGFHALQKNPGLLNKMIEQQFQKQNEVPSERVWAKLQVALMQSSVEMESTKDGGSTISY